MEVTGKTGEGLVFDSESTVDAVSLGLASLSLTEVLRIIYTRRD